MLERENVSKMAVFSSTAYRVVGVPQVDVRRTAAALGSPCDAIDATHSRQSTALS